MSESELERELAFQMRAAKIVYEREFCAVPGRRFRWDFVVPHHCLLIEVDGGTWSNGRHSRGSGIEKDCEKQSLAAVNGWLVIRVTGAQVKSGQALEWIQEAM